MGSLILVVAALSYVGQISIPASAARVGHPDVEVFACGVHNALDEPAQSVVALAS